MPRNALDSEALLVVMVDICTYFPPSPTPRLPLPPLSPLVLLPVISLVFFSPFYAPGPLLGGFDLPTQGDPSVLFPSPLCQAPIVISPCLSPFMKASKPAQRFKLRHASLSYLPPTWRASLAKIRRHTSLIPTVLTPGNLSRAISRSAMMVR